MNLWVIFITGLTVGGLTCLAVQGGLLASVTASRKNALIATIAFLITKLLAYMLLGFVLGAFGGALNISGAFQTYMQLLAGLYMVAVALNILEIHPIFRYVILQPPRFLTKLVHNQSKSTDIFAPALLGAMTIFIPCGTTLAMEALAISTANALSGALIMMAFILGTVPLFFGIGFVTSLLGDTFRKKFFTLAAVIVLYLGLTSINGALTALGSPLTIQAVTGEITALFRAVQTPSVSMKNETINQHPEIVITAHGYAPNYLRVQRGAEVTLTVISKDAYSCASAFRIPSLGIAKNFGPNETQVITFTPTQPGKIPFTCSMGMYTGTIEVI